MAKLRPARSYQTKDAPLRRIADAAIPGIKKDLRDSLAGLSDLVPDEAGKHARQGDWEGLKNAIQWSHFREVLKAPFGRIGKAHEAAAQYGAGRINAAFARAGRKVRFRKSLVQPKMLFGQPQFPALIDMDALLKDASDQYAFDLYTRDVQDQLRQAQNDLIVQLEEDARDAIDTIIMNGARDGSSPEEILEDIRSWIGLTDTQAQAVANYRGMLENLDPDALERRLRNVLEDEGVAAAIENDDPLDPDFIDKLTQDYADNFLDYRAETIATTEGTRAVNAGLQDSYQQAIDRGVFPSDAVTQHWIIQADACPICQSCADMNPDGVGIDEAFDSIDGPQDQPPDPHPNCRCEIEIVTDLDHVPEE